MFSQVNSTKYFRGNYANYLLLFTSIQTNRTLPCSLCEISYTLIPKEKNYIKKLETILFHEYNIKNQQENVTKLNPAVYKRAYTSLPNGIHFRYLTLVEHMCNRECIPSRQQGKRENLMIISPDAG